MAGRKRLGDVLTLDMFEIPTTSEPTAGSLDNHIEIAHTISEALRKCGQDRFEVAARMGRYTGEDVSKFMLDAYASPGRCDHNISVNRAIAFDAATQGYALLNLHARKLGCKVVMADEAILVEKARLEQEIAEAKRKMKFLDEHYKG